LQCESLCIHGRSRTPVPTIKIQFTLVNPNLSYKLTKKVNVVALRDKLLLIAVTFFYKSFQKSFLKRRTVNFFLSNKEKGHHSLFARGKTISSVGRQKAHVLFKGIFGKIPRLSFLPKNPFAYFDKLPNGKFLSIC